METNVKTKITVQSEINAPVEKVWKNWTAPDDIVHWNHASDDWHSPRAKNDFRTGGLFNYRMEAKDGSMGFDFGGIYNRIVTCKLIEYTLGDGRKVRIDFSSEDNKTLVVETFEAENENSVDLQRNGWQAILDNFKKYAEGDKSAALKHQIFPCLWFNGNAKEAADFYCSVFKDSSLINDNPVVVTFQSGGQRFMCLNGEPEFSFNSSVSFYVVIENELELNETWNKLLEGGSVLMPLQKYDWSEKYGWVQDKFSVSWQLSLGKLQDVGQKFTPLLMFSGEQSGKAAEAVEFYTSVFRDSTIKGIMKYTLEENEAEGTVKHAQFSLGKNVFMAMDSSLPHNFSFNEAISFVVNCDTQAEIDYYWEKLTRGGGQEVQCGWLKDKFGVSWQIVPAILEDLMHEPARADRIMKAILPMKKLDIEKIKQA